MSEGTSNSKLSIPETAIRNVLQVQSSAIEALNQNETVEEIQHAAKLIDNSEGRVTITGIGKSGDVAKKIVGTLNSIGVTSHFVHPVEALHGDLGGISDDDIVILISNSGTTDEVVEFLQFLNSVNVTTIAITSDQGSTLGTDADHHINTKINEEGAVVDLVPMASTTVTMVIGDCIANALMARRDFDKHKFGHFHPAGSIGKRLLLDVSDLLVEDIPKTEPTDSLAQVVMNMSEGGKGIAVIQDESSKVMGILTDGDIRRLVEAGNDLHNVTAETVMTTNPIMIHPSIQAVRALEILEKYDITQLVVVDENDIFEGVVHIHDIMQEGLSVDRGTKTLEADR